MRLGRVAGALALAVLGGVVLGPVGLTSPTPAYAHNALTSVSPADGSTVSQAPGEIVLTFDQPVLGVGAAVVVTDANTIEYQEGRPRLVDNTVTQLLRSAAPAGDYRVQWRVTSADGHPIDGVTTFTATAAGAVRTASPEPSDPADPSAGAPVDGVEGSGAAGPSYAWLVLVAVVAVLIAGLVVVRRRTDRSLARSPDPVDAPDSPDSPGSPALSQPDPADPDRLDPHPSAAADSTGDDRRPTSP